MSTNNNLNVKEEFKIFLDVVDELTSRRFMPDGLTDFKFKIYTDNQSGKIITKIDYGDEEEMLEAIALKLNRKKQGGAPDIETTARLILQQWQKGAISR